MIVAIKPISFKRVLQQILIAIIAVVIAILIRKYLLHSLENKVPWLTYYPAVMAAALFGGFFSGFLSSALSCIVTIYGYTFFASLPFIDDKADWIGLFVFVVNCILVSIIADYSKKANKAKVEAEMAKEQSDLANRSKSLFLANMSHELRTPLNAILGFTRLMKLNTDIPEVEQKNLEIINRSGEHLLSLINNVLDISKIEAGQTEIDNSVFNLNSALHDVLLIMSQRAEAKELFLKISISETLPTNILYDELKIKQILINILGNAIKYTNQGNILLTVSAEENLQPGINLITIEVQDTGIGISAADIHKVFDPFIQVGNNVSNKGTGLGLTISKQFTELLGGTISVESKLGIGSKFTVQIPYKLADKEIHESSKFDFIQSITPEETQKRILIVEDQIENWMLLQKILEKIGFEVKVAENGEDGVEAFNSFHPNLIFMDVRMPIMNGMEATRRIRGLDNGKLIKIVGISAHVFKDEIQSILASGMDDFVKKPYQLNDIYTSLQKHLGVKYIYYSNKDALRDEPLQLSIEMLQSLDPMILLELKEYVESLDNEKLLNLAERISLQNKELGSTLHDYVSNYKITEILRLLNQIHIS
jgi:signal transduction histidine kinase/DNA-binding response OmpR family regulator